MNKKLVISETLFDLTQEQEDKSKEIYDGKIIKCLVAPYHSFLQLEHVVPYSKTTYLFPEREMTIPQTKQFIFLLVKSKENNFKIITKETNIILDMYDGCVRILDARGVIHESPAKTFMANPHTIRYELLENENHTLNGKETTIAHDRINKLIEKINKGGKRRDLAKVIQEIELIGEPLISNKLKNMALDSFIK